MDARERLVESTRELLAERGYTGTSPAAIQQRSGVGQGSMYHHFRGKAGLAAEAIGRNAADLADRADADLSGPGTAVERVTRYLRRERDALRGCPVGGLAQDPGVVDDPAARRLLADAFARVTDRLAGVLEQGRAAGELDAGLDPRATATALVAVLQGGYVLARSAGSAAPFAAAVDGALALLAGRVP